MVSLIVDFLKNYTVKNQLGNQKARKFGRTILIEDKTSRVLHVAKTIEKTSKNELLITRIKAESTFNFEYKHLPKVTELIETENHIALILEYQPGITIDEYWQKLKRKERHLFLTAFLSKLNSIFKTLKEFGVVHCDIKPSNILIHQDGDEMQVYLIDFGMALRTKNKETRKILFPLGYAAPELLLNHLDVVDQRTDIYSLGILIWRLYSGHLPLKHSNPSVYTNLQLTHPLPTHPRVPKETFKILNKMSAKHSFRLPPNRMNYVEVKEKLIEGKSNRYQDIDSVLSDLREIKLYLFQSISRR